MLLGSSRVLLEGAEDRWAVRCSILRRQLNRALTFDAVLIGMFGLLLDYFPLLLCRKQEILDVYYASQKCEIFRIKRLF